MNTRVRDVLIEAGLRGHRQIQERWHDRDAPEGECVLGLLHCAVHPSRKAALSCVRWGLPDRCQQKINRTFDLTAFDRDVLVTANDEFQWDFLTIARKVEIDEEA